MQQGVLFDRLDLLIFQAVCAQFWAAWKGGEISEIDSGGVE
jgi:hypothetical protein